MFFDLNGTLINDNEHWFDCVQEVFRKFGGKAPTVREYFEELDKDYAHIYSGRGVTASRDEMNAVYEPKYKSDLEKISLFPGVIETLENLYREGIPMGLVTGQTHDLAFPMLEHLGVGEHIFQKNLSSVHEGHKEKVLREILDRTGVEARNCFFIGDSPADIAHANKVGLQSVAFLSGFIPKDLVLAKNPTHSIHHMSALTALI